METQKDATRELTLLEQVERDPNVNQATLAGQLGVAVGTVNWHLKRLVAKGYVKVQRAERKKLRYIITPEGIALRARLTIDYLERSFELYRHTRERIKEHLDAVRAAGHSRIRIVGDGDVADICRLTCLEQGFNVVQEGDCPSLVLKGWKVLLYMGDQP
ncbi:MAG TPA: winged helix-turn-helix transcriptional regulator [Anaerolineales bacterium]